ncbi:DUF3304 domain-containing protein [Stenotrophomonas sp. MMGLT7]|uniref:DUF3304 domain-containing protein n=1 Tax=Stenotrophomonas sp. MMGLT7 TaxID=2901227 RepID=UPI001E4A1BE0|nr:DUF3304 domain-containing protein [Stenotrophomonas sp. MMGLT7]MCD7099296.1 DUF3304 domain-containing protein [Stenotrophomonas sp. MMGLT7]
MKINITRISLSYSWMKLTRLLIVGLSMAMGGCMAQEMSVNVVVFNYTSSPLGDMVVQGKYVGGYFQAYGSGGTGGGIYCCIDVKPGAADVRWTYGGIEGAPRAGIQASSTGKIPKPSGAYKYLGVHVYPEERVEFTLTRDIPPEKKEGEP